MLAGLDGWWERGDEKDGWHVSEEVNWDKTNEADEMNLEVDSKDEVHM